MNVEMRARILEAAKNEPSPTRSQTALRAAVYAGFAILISGCIFGALGVGPLPRSFLARCAAGWGAIAIFLTMAALARTKTMLGLPTRALAFAAIFAGPIVLAWAIAMLELTDARTSAPPFRAHFMCFSLALAMAAAPLALLLYLRRRSDPVHPHATGAVIGAAAGAWGGLLIHLHCPFADPLHMLLGHVLPISALAVLGALAGSVLGVRR